MVIKKKNIVMSIVLLFFLTILVCYPSSSTNTQRNDGIAKDFVAVVVENKEWVYANKKFEKYLSINADSNVVSNKEDNLIKKVTNEFDLKNKYFIKKSKEYFNKFDDDYVVNKWLNPIRISAYESPVVEEHIAVLIKELNEIPNLEIELVKESQSEIANVNIHIYGNINEVVNKKYCVGFPCYDSFSENWEYKMNFPERIYVHNEISWGDKIDDFKINVDRLYQKKYIYYRDATYFSHSNAPHVEGFFFSNKKNEIQFSECYIWAGHEELILKELASECVVRSLGLPNVSTSAESVLLANRESSIALHNSSMSDYDRILITVLYDRKIAPGLKSNDVYKLVKQILKR